MATVVSARPAVQTQKVKRPQTTTNAPSSSAEQHQDTSASTNSARPPNDIKQPSATNVGVTNTSSSSTARLGNRRRDSHKQHEDSQRLTKGARPGVLDITHNDKRNKQVVEPYVRTTGHILRKHSRSRPSFILHLHPTHFRFDEQDGSFSYNSPMRALLEHIRTQTVPHEMLEELVAAGIKFYDNCLIVQVQDHRNSSPTAHSTATSGDKELNQPYSIHNYNQHITPSPFVSYPRSRSPDNTSSANKQTTKNTSPAPEATGNEAGNNRDTPQDEPNGPKIFTTVLFPTAISLQEELANFASTPDTRSNSRKHTNPNSKPTGSTTAPLTPSGGAFLGSNSANNANKKQKLMYNAKDLVEFEAKIVSATAPPLFLDPVNTLEEAQALIEQLHDPLLAKEPAAPKSRKRTVAELAADEALAAEEQRFMLIMDERLISNSAASSANKTVGTGAETGNGTFEARFERFKAIDEIRSSQQEKRQREQEAKAAHQQQQQKLKLEQQERDAIAAAAARQQASQEQKAREGLNAQRRQEQIQSLQARQLQTQQGQQGIVQQIPGQHAHPQTSGSMMHNSQQLAVSQAHHSSPVVRNGTPHNMSSPMVSNTANAHIGQSIPMSASTSNQGAGSPPRPGSAMQHPHQAVALTAQRNPQPPSRNGTPTMPNGTPRMQQSTPDLRNVTPTPRANFASPVLNQAPTTQSMNHFVGGTPQMNGQHLTPQQQQQMLLHQRMHNQQMQSSPNGQMPSQNLQQLAAQQFAAQQAQRAGSEANYRQSLQNLTQQQMSTAQMNHQGYPNNMGLHHMQMQQNIPQGNNIQQNNRWQSMYQSALNQFLTRFRDQAIAAYGSHLPPVVQQQIRSQADARARALVTQKRQQESRQQQIMLQHGNNSLGGMGGMGAM